MQIKWFSLVRITGLLLVLLYHFFIKYFPGGFVGVDIFLTFSGYLITALFIDEYARNKEIDVRSFFKRRLYRILPPLVLMIVLILPLTLLIRNDFRAGIGHQVSATLGFVTNWFEILSGSNYENQFAPHLFVHTWTLALEVQLYLFWVAIVYGLTKFTKSVGQLRGLIFLTSASLFSLSFLAMFVSSFFVDNFSTIYFSTITHSFPFFLGALLATLAGISNTVRAFKRTSQTWSIKKSIIIFGAALAVQVSLLFFLRFDSLITYLFGFVIASVAAAVMIYATRVLHEQTPHAKEPVLITSLADISYGIYLFHWPLYIIFNLVTSHTLAVLLTLILSILLASLSFYLLEPFWTGRVSKVFSTAIDLRPYTKWIVGTLGTLACIGVIISLTAPALGDLEVNMMTNGLKQANNRLLQTKTFAEQGKASSYDVPKGTLIIGDSVTLRASTPLAEVLPGALIDAQGSRNTQQAYEILKNNIDSGTLVENVVIATGVNIVYNYEEELNKIVDLLPKGYRLIFVTPYDGNWKSYDNPVAEKHAEYVRKLAKEHDYIFLADWNQVSKDRPELWTGSDGIHFGTNHDHTLEGGKVYAQTIQAALEAAEKGPVKQ